MFEPGGDLKVGDVILVMSPISPEETGRSGGGGVYLRLILEKMDGSAWCRSKLARVPCNKTVSLGT